MFSRQAVLRAARSAAPQRAIQAQARTYAAAASNEKVKAPVSLFGLDGTYATALVRPSLTSLSGVGHFLGCFFRKGGEAIELDTGGEHINWKWDNTGELRKWKRENN